MILDKDNETSFYEVEKIYKLEDLVLSSIFGAFFYFF